MQIFLKELGDKLGKAADKLRYNLGDTNHKHSALGLIFLKSAFDTLKSERHFKPHQPYQLDSLSSRIKKCFCGLRIASLI